MKLDTQWGVSVLRPQTVVKMEFAPDRHRSAWIDAAFVALRILGAISFTVCGVVAAAIFLPAEFRPFMSMIGFAIGMLATMVFMQ